MVSWARRRCSVISSCSAFSFEESHSEAPAYGSSHSPLYPSSLFSLSFIVDEYSAGSSNRSGVFFTSSFCHNTAPAASARRSEIRVILRMCLIYSLSSIDILIVPVQFQRQLAPIDQFWRICCSLYEKILQPSIVYSYTDISYQ